MPLDGSLGVLVQVIASNHELGWQVVVEANQEGEYSLIDGSLLFQCIDIQLGHVSESVWAEAENTITNQRVESSLGYNCSYPVVVCAHLTRLKAYSVSACEPEDSSRAIPSRHHSPVGFFEICPC